MPERVWSNRSVLSRARTSIEWMIQAASPRRVIGAVWGKTSAKGYSYRLHHIRLRESARPPSGAAEQGRLQRTAPRR